MGPSAGPSIPGPPSIGRDDQPIRVLSLASGGFETARQLGVAHALLVSRGKPPEMVIGASAGAVNAVAIAEVLQAGAPNAGTTSRLAARVARFREIFESYQNCPGDLAGAMLPDTYQIDTRKPLEQVRLPIHAVNERDQRAKALRAKAGLLNLYNDLLRLRLSIGTTTKFIRRGLGIQAAGAEPTALRRTLARLLESFRLWGLIGFHLPELTVLAWPVTRAAFGRQPATEEGSPAAQMIFRSRLFARATGFLGYFLGFVFVLCAWILVSSFLLSILPALVTWLASHLPWSLRILYLPPGVAWRPWSVDPGHGTPELIFRIDVALVVLLGVVALGAWVLRGRRPISWVLPGAAGVGVGVLAMYGAAIRILSTTPVDEIGPLWLALRHNALMAAAGVLLLAFVSGVLACRARETSKGTEFLQVMGSAFTFLMLYGAVLLTLVGAVWLASRFAGPISPQLLAWILIVLFHVLAVAVVAVAWCGPQLPVNLLKLYDLADSLGNEYPLRQVFVRLFDPGYYGTIPMDTVLDQAMRYGASPYDAGGNQVQVPVRKLLKAYWSNRGDPIYVAITAADVGAASSPGQQPSLDILPPDEPVVDALLAATAVTPLLPPRRLTDQRLVVDAANLTSEPTGAALNYLRLASNANSTAIHLYPVSHLPLSYTSLPDPNPDKYGELLNVVLRARELERFRDAKLDRNLTRMFTLTLPSNVKGRFNTAHGSYVRTYVFPIETDTPAHVNEQVVQARSPADRRRIIAETVADGCRASLETMLVPHTRAASKLRPSEPAKCRAAVTLALQARRSGDAGSPGIPGSSSDPAEGPGLAEVCRHCVLGRGKGAQERPRSLQVDGSPYPPPEWPDEESLDPPPSFTQPVPRKTGSAGLPTGTTWPLPRGLSMGGVDQTVSGTVRPTVSLLFSGGVFRGVYQMGALNGMHEAGLKPDIIAGASVGSITAAMVARVFTSPSEAERRGRIARLAAVYLGVDRLVMTDRFADFIRAVTIRAAHTEFSIRDADRVFRRYDSPWSGVYEREARRVVAGIERLFYVSPFELKDLVEALRRHDTGGAVQQARKYLQDLLNQLGVSDQVLGAEPLRLLIDQYVLKGLGGATAPDEVPFDVFLNKGLCFVATTTNLTAGRLDVLGRSQLTGTRRAEQLGEGLLASSAFPGVFRPRWAWEVMPGSGVQDRYMDGGVIDNLPLEEVAQFLHVAANGGAVARRPALNGVDIPHLVLATSLEPRLGPCSGDALKQLEQSWLRLYRRAARLAYNLKLDVFAEAQRGLRDVVDTMRARELPDGPFTPLDLELVAVKPAWLCGTFAFHPMMGFRRENQARSIAHGCHTTLVELGRRYYAPPPVGHTWGDAWGLKPGSLPAASVVNADPPPARVPGVGRGQCWIRPDRPCPFSRAQAQAALLGYTDAWGVPGAPQAMDRTADELDMIYQFCGQAKTHSPKDD
jgi:predicted acylesterase/phospholipase RssA